MMVVAIDEDDLNGRVPKRLGGVEAAEPASHDDDGRLRIIRAFQDIVLHDLPSVFGGPIAAGQRCPIIRMDPHAR